MSNYPFAVERLTSVRASAAVAALLLVAAVVVMAFANDNPAASMVSSETPDAASFTPISDADELKAAVRSRPAQLTQRHDITSKSRVVALIVALLFAAPLRATYMRAVPPANPACYGRSRSLRLRAPPALQPRLIH